MPVKPILLSLTAIFALGAVYFYLAYLRPIPPFQPTGDYAIGTTSFDIEPTHGTPPEKIAIRAWYPSRAETGTRALVSSQRLVDTTVAYYKMPDFMATTAPSLSFTDAPIAEGPFPVLVFNHGFGSFAEQNTTNMQELASNGYIVLSLSHPQTSLLTEYTDGTAIAYNPDLPAFKEQAELAEAAGLSLDAMARTLAATERATGFESYWQAMRTLAQGPLFANMQPILRSWVADSNAVINAIAEGQTGQFPAFLAAQMEGDKIGIFGHSLGGMAAIAASMRNENIKAVINLDGPFAFDEPAENITLPAPTCMVMASGFGAGGEVISIRNINTPLFERATRGGCVAVFNGAWHMNFTDLNDLPFLRLIKVLGPVDQRKFAIELNHLLVSFFDRQLKGDETPYAPVYDTIVDYEEF